LCRSRPIVSPLIREDTTGGATEETLGAPLEKGAEEAFPGRTGERREGLYEAPRGLVELEYEVIDGQPMFEGDILLPAGAGNPHFGGAFKGQARNTFHNPNSPCPSIAFPATSLSNRGRPRGLALRHCPVTRSILA